MFCQVTPTFSFHVNIKQTAKCHLTGFYEILAFSSWVLIWRTNQAKTYEKSIETIFPPNFQTHLSRKPEEKRTSLTKLFKEKDFYIIQSDRFPYISHFCFVK